MGNKQSDVTPLSLHRSIIAWIIILIVGIGAWLAFEARHHEEDHIRAELLRQAKSVASTLSMENMRDLSFRAEDAELPAYQQITSQLQVYSQTLGTHRLYTLGFRDGQLFFGPGGWHSDDPYAVPPGTIHEKPTPTDWQAFRSGEPGVVGLHSDEFGEFVSALVPVVDSLSGEVLLVVGLDMEASVFRQRLVDAQRTPLWSTLSLLVVLLLGSSLHEFCKRSPNTQPETLRNIHISTCFVVMLMLTVIAFICVRDIEKDTQEELFKAEAYSISLYLAEATEQIDLVLHLMIGFFEGSENITREEFGTFCRHIFEGYPIQSCVWLPELSSSDVPAFTDRIRSEGLSDFSIRRFAKDNRPDQNPSNPIYPAVYIEPASRLPATLGYDFYSHPVIRKTLEKTLRSGSDHACMISAPTSTSTEPAGFFVFVPISHTRHKGVICFSVNVDALIKTDEISTTLLELSSGKEPQALACSRSSCDGCDHMLESDLTVSAPLFAFGNSYALLFTAESAWASTHYHGGEWWTLAIGTLITLLLTYTIAVLINRPLLLSKRVTSRTHELAESKERFDIAIAAAAMGVWEQDLLSGRLIWDDRMLEIYGMQGEKSEIDSSNWAKFIHPEDHNRFMREWTATERGEKNLNTEVRIVRKNGEIRHISVFGKIIFGADGNAKRMVGVNLDITDRKAAEKALEESRQLLCNIIDTMPERVWWKDRESRFLGCNIHVAHDAGLDHPDQLIGKTDFDMCWAVHAETFQANDRKVMESGIPRLFDPELQVMEDGSTRWIEVSSIPLKDTSGKVFGVLGSYSEVTERMTTQEAIEKGAAQLRRAQAVAHVGNWEFDLNNGTVIVSVEARRIYGLDESEWTISEIQKIALNEHRERLDKALKALIQDGTPYNIEFAIKRPTDGAIRDINSVAEYDPEKNLVFGVIQDITVRKQTELSLARSEAKYRDLFEQSADAFLIIKNKRFIDCNQAAVDMLHYSQKQDLLDTHPSELSPDRQPDGRLSMEKAEELMQRVTEEKSLRFEWMHRRADGEVFPVEVTLTSITDSEGVNIIHTAWRDITDRKLAEESLIRLSTAIEQSPESIVIADTNGDIQYVNPAFENNTGYTADEALGQNPRILKSGEHPPSFYEEMWRTLTHGGTWEGRITNKRKDGTLFTEEVSISSVLDDNGSIVNYIAVKRNIMEELVKEEELRQAQKMEAVGQLAGGVAHDFNNIMQGIIGLSELLRYSLDDTSMEHKNAEEIHKAANRAVKLTQQLLTFSRKQVVRLEEQDLNEIVYDAEALLSVLLGSDKYELVLDLADNLPPIAADHGQLTQVIMNLAVNARDAMTEGGRLSISTEDILLQESDAAYITGARPGTYVCISVTDTGSGMDEETQKRIFEPFFTTKEVGQGTGLGLSVIFGIIQQNKGWISVYSEIGKGTCFKVYLPVAGANGESAGASLSTAQQDRNARILLIEDDPKIRKMVQKVLGAINVTILAAGSAEDGVTLFNQSTEPFDLLMSDMELPGMRGDELAEALRKKNPDLPVLLFSGYRDQVNRWKGLADRGYEFLNKPFTINILLDTVQNIINDKEGIHG